MIALLATALLFASSADFHIPEDLVREWVTPDRVIDEEADDITESYRQYKKPAASPADVPTNTNYRLR